MDTVVAPVTQADLDDRLDHLREYIGINIKKSIQRCSVPKAWMCVEVLIVAVISFLNLFRCRNPTEKIFFASCLIFYFLYLVERLRNIFCILLKDCEILCDIRDSVFGIAWTQAWNAWLSLGITRAQALNAWFSLWNC